MGCPIILERKDMAFSGSFIYFKNTSTGNWDAFDNSKIYKESLSGALEVQDIDSTRNANGELKRNALSHTAYTIEFEIPPCWNDKMDAIWSFIRSHYTNALERKINVKYYNHEKGAYETGSFYVATPKFNVNRVDGTKIFYNGMTVNMIQY